MSKRYPLFVNKTPDGKYEVRAKYESEYSAVNTGIQPGILIATITPVEGKEYTTKQIVNMLKEGFVQLMMEQTK